MAPMISSGLVPSGVDIEGEREGRHPWDDLVENCWQSLLDTDDRTSPEEYPDMCLINREELSDFIREAFESLRPGLDATVDALTNIKRFGELACVDCGSQFYTGGKKPASKDVWQFPRHMLAEIDRAIQLADQGNGK